MPKLFALQPAAVSVSQADLENIVSLTNQITRLRAMRDKLTGVVLERLLAGAEAEVGPRACDVETSWSKATKKQKLVVR